MTSTEDLISNGERRRAVYIVPEITDRESAIRRITETLDDMLISYRRRHEPKTLMGELAEWWENWGELIQAMFIAFWIATGAVFFPALLVELIKG